MKVSFDTSDSTEDLQRCLELLQSVINQRNGSSSSSADAWDTPAASSTQGGDMFSMFSDTPVQEAAQPEPQPAPEPERPSIKIVDF